MCSQMDWVTWVNIVLTLVIAGATICYTVYAQRQWKTMKRQADDAEAVQAARLTYEEFQATILPGPNFVADVTVTVRNNGSTVADDINFNMSWGAYNLGYNPNPEPTKGQLRPTPDPAGPSLGPGKTRIYQDRAGETRMPPK
jgi:hypothetical protein